jgi:penicillin-binding protein 2
LILDRNGVILVDNYPSYELTVIREDVDDLEELIGELARLLHKSRTEMEAAFDGIRRRPAFKPFLVFKDLTWKDLVTIETHRFELPGVMITVKPRRRYLHDGLAAHVIGYLGEVTAAQLDREAYSDHRMGDLAGQYGLEMELERHLHGRRGRRLVEVDASGRVLNVIKNIDPEPGDNVYLTLDARLQEVAQTALGDQVGAAVALDPNTGEVLVLASAPTFNQSDFVQGISPEKWRALVDNPFHPLENRAISGQYPPGSTFKIVSAAAALEEEVVTPQSIIYCPGHYPFGNRVFHCWKKGGHGGVDLHRSLKESCDVYYYDVGRRLGIDRLADYSRRFGLGSRTGVGLSSEKAGLVPTKDWKMRRFKNPWMQGETLSVVIGQGYNLATPLQMAQVVSVVANGGVLYRPQLVEKIASAGGEIIQGYQPEKIRELDLEPQTLDLIKKALVGVVNEPGGTGRRARVEGVTVGGKTGTSQVVALKKFRHVPEKDLPYKYRDHAWFVAFAPAEKPEIAVAVVLEHAGHGGSAAAPVAQKILDAFFHPEELAIGAQDEPQSPSTVETTVDPAPVGD